MPLRDRAANPFGNGPNELPLFLEERAAVDLRNCFPVRDLHHSGGLILNNDLGALHPPGFLEVRSLEGFVLKDDSRLADFGILPTWGKDLNNLVKNFLQ